MSTNLPANIDELSATELMALLGQSVATNTLPVLRVNYDDAEGEDGISIPRGQWCLTLPTGERIFAPQVTFRLFFSAYQYSHYDSAQNKMVSKSVYFQDFRGEVPDTTGGFKCGKLSKKEREKLSEAEQELQNEIKCSRVLFGLVSIGNVTDQPCMFYARGTNFIPVSDFLKALDKDRIVWPTITLNLSLERHKNGGVTFWQVIPTRGDIVKLVASDYDLIRNFAETIAAENNQVLEQWKKNRKEFAVQASQKLVTPRAETFHDDGLGPMLEGVSSDIDLTDYRV